MKYCTYCGRDNEDTAAVCRECGKHGFREAPSATQSQAATNSEASSSWASKKRGIRFLLAGLAGGSLLVAVCSAAFDIWEYFTRWLSGLAAVGLAVGYIVIRRWLTKRAIRFAEEPSDDIPPAGPDSLGPKV